MNITQVLEKKIDESKQGESLSIVDNPKGSKKMYIESYGRL